jgi:hypothetical protein
MTTTHHIFRSVSILMECYLVLFMYLLFLAFSFSIEPSFQREIWVLVAAAEIRCTGSSDK